MLPEALGTEVSSKALGTEALGTEALLATWSVANDQWPEASRTASESLQTNGVWIVANERRLNRCKWRLKRCERHLNRRNRSLNLHEWRLDRCKRHLNRHYRRLNRRDFVWVLLRQRRFLRRRAQATSIPTSASSGDGLSKKWTNHEGSVTNVTSEGK